MSAVVARIAGFDWPGVERDLDAQGSALLPGLLTLLALLLGQPLGFGLPGVALRLVGLDYPLVIGIALPDLSRLFLGLVGLLLLDLTAHGLLDLVAVLLVIVLHLIVHSLVFHIQ